MNGGVAVPDLHFQVQPHSRREEDCHEAYRRAMNRRSFDRRVLNRRSWNRCSMSIAREGGGEVSRSHTSDVCIQRIINVILRVLHVQRL